MKKITLAVAAVLMFGNTALAAANENRFGIGYAPETAPPITFMERGIEFFIFMDGQFDFNTAPSTGGAIYYKNGRRGVNSTYGAPGVPAGGVIIEHDYLGRVRRVGNVFINYDAQDRIKRVGSVYMTYNRQYLTQVGGLKISFDRRGMIADIRGNVNNTNQFNNGSAYNTTYYGPATGHNDNIYYKPGKTTRK